jgi:hypothetical protein
LIGELTSRYAVSAPGDGGGQAFRVLVEDSGDPHEATMRLAVALDEIDPGWEQHFLWPRKE